MQTSVREPSETVRGAAPILTLVFILLACYGWILNASVYSVVGTYAGIAREIGTCAMGLALLGLGLAARFRPLWLDKRLLLAAALFFSLAAALILLLAIPSQNGAITVAGLILLNLGMSWAHALTALSLSAFTSFRTAVTAIALGYALGEVVTLLAPAPTLEVGILLCCLASPAVVVLQYRTSAQPLGAITQGTPAADLEISNPESFLDPISKLSICALLFGFAFGYGLALNQVNNAPVSISFFGLIIPALALWIIFCRGEERADSLFSVCALLVVAGFLLAPFTFSTEYAFANGLLRAGSKTFEILLWIVFVAVGRRNLYALLPTWGSARCLELIGLSLGAIIGHTSNTLVEEGAPTAAILAALFVFLFVAILWLVLRKYSFEATIQGVATFKAAPPETPESEEFTFGDLEKRCLELGEKKGLTARQIEIFTLLARGRNGLVIREHFVLSRNTVKSHTRSIYQKLGVHSQQELIDLVEGYRK